MRYSCVLCVVFSLVSCGGVEKNDGKLPDGEWVSGSDSEKIKAVERQFRGFDMAMVETGYRFQELYWAGSDENWDYADYQVEKLRKAIENGLERRPKRAESAQSFLNTALPEMREAVKSRDLLSFEKGYEMLTEACNNCHKMEEVPHFKVQQPQRRVSPIVFD